MDPSFKPARNKKTTTPPTAFDGSTTAAHAEPSHWAACDEPDEAMVDSLADLFLGGGLLSPELPAPRKLKEGSPQLRLISPELQWDGGTEQPEHHTITDLPGYAQHATIEAVILGHLPVIAPAWGLQYAGHRARELGEPVALVRLDAGAVSVELIAPPSMSPIGPQPTFDSLADAVHHAANRARIWIVRADEAAQRSLAASSDLDTITVLTGADEAAIVSCYSTLKSISNDLNASIGDDETAPALGVGIMGATAERAQRAAHKLNKAANTFLGHDHLNTALLPRMTTTHAVAVFRGTCQDPAPVFIASIRDALEIAQPVSLEYIERPNERLPELPVEPVVEPRTKQVDPLLEQQQQVVFDDRWDDEHLPADPDASELNPAMLLEGYTELDFECPAAPSVDLAIDAQGRLQLIAMDSDESDIVSQLTHAMAWAQSHAKLLQRAEPRLCVPIQPTLHVLTTRSQLVRTLMDTDIKIHLMAHASTATRGWVVRALND